MKTILLFLIFLLTTIPTFSQSFEKKSNSIVSDTIKIANEELEYEVVIIDVGFASWLNGRAFPRNYHSESFLENKNQWYVSEWNRRVLQPQLFDPNLYEMNINYNPSIHYGYEVNYLIYNYMIYFQNTFNQRLFGFIPPR